MSNRVRSSTGRSSSAVAAGTAATAACRAWGARLALCSVAVALPVLGDAAAASAADGAQLLDCIKRVQSASRAGVATRELIAAVACRGVSAEEVGGPEFSRRVEVIRECFDKVVFRSDATGTDAELIAATACVGAVDAEETALCVEKVGRTFDHTRGAEAELLAAGACARGNPAGETAGCVDHLSFRLNSSGAVNEALASWACGR